MKDRYDVSNLPEGQFEPGSKGLVLKNLLGIKSKKEMEALETDQYMSVLDSCARRYGRSHRFTANDLLDIHKEWLGGIYSWAGTYRSINISKGNFHFAAAAHIPGLMVEFTKDVLSVWTPCHESSFEQNAKAMAIVHAEFILIHPFREGNGRMGRLLANLMALQAGLVPLDFGDIKGRKQKFYIAAVQTAMRKDYAPMQKVFGDVIRKTMRQF